MNYKFGVGDEVIAKNTNLHCGYRKGDRIRITKEAVLGDLVGVNLTTPHCYGADCVYMGGYFRGKRITNSKIDYRVHFLGIPILTIRKDNDNAGE